MKKVFDTIGPSIPEGREFEISVTLNSTGNFHHVIVAGDGYHEEKLCSSWDLEETITKMEWDVRRKFTELDPVEILKGLGFK